MNKILIYIFIVLVIIISIEFGYYTFLSPNRSQTSVNTTQINKPTSSKPPAEICYSLKSKSSGVLNETLLEELKRISNIAFVSSNLINIRQGKIIEIDTKGGFIPIDKDKYKNLNEDQFKYQLLMKIKKEKDTDTLNFIWPQEMFTANRIEIVKRNGTKEETIQVNELKIGDEVIVEQNVNLTEKECYKPTCSKYKIIKI